MVDIEKGSTQKNITISYNIALSLVAITIIVIALTVHEIDPSNAENNIRFQKNLIFVLSTFVILILGTIAFAILRPLVNYISQTQKKALELNKLKSDFLANMSHEIRTPMNGIVGITELLLETNLDNNQQNYVHRLQNSADHLLGIINDILDFSKIEAGQMKIDPILFNLLTTIENIFEMLSPNANDKKLELLLDYSNITPRFITADPGRIRQVLLNLISNAIKFTDQGYIMVRVNIAPIDHEKKVHQLNVSVEDTGVGIPENKIPLLFEKFMQVESGSTRAQQGSGLGLAITKNLLKLMNGDISVTSTIGKGTIFSWHIPVSEVCYPKSVSNKYPRVTGKRVLFVDDLKQNILLLKEILIEDELECLFAENYEEALSILEYQYSIGSKIDVVVTDYMMPEKTGLDLISTIKSDERFSRIPTIILSSSDEPSLMKLFEQADIAACIIKPIKHKQMMDILEKVLHRDMREEKQNFITSAGKKIVSTQEYLENKILKDAKILLVEDNKVNMEIMTRILSILGCQVISAENGLIAIELVKKQQFDLIFMDCQMPEMDGFEAARNIANLKNNGLVASVPIVALTANALKEDRQRCLDSGMDDYLSKPVRKNLLEAMLLKWLRESQMRKTQQTNLT